MKPQRKFRLSPRSVLLSFALAATVASAGTKLSDTPISGASQIAGTVAPNIMFVFDESKSMELDASPDWADGTNNTNDGDDAYKLRIDVSQLKNAKFNGLAYNPAITYLPPAYFKADGTPDTTTYPTQNRAVTTNWTKVKNNPYQSGAGEIDLSSLNNFYFSIKTNEYCADVTLRTCAKQSAPSVAYPIPAYLRWCKSAAYAKSGTIPTAAECQASQVNNSEGVNKFGYPRMVWPVVSTLKFLNGQRVTSLKNSSSGTSDDKQLLSVPVDVQPDAASLALALQKSINACSIAITGDCEVAGYVAIATGDILRIYSPVTITTVDENFKAPSIIPSRTFPDVSQYAQPKFMSWNSNYQLPNQADLPANTNRALSNNVPGSNMPTLIEPDRTAYPKIEGAKRSDCAGASSCTFDEEMTNYANWWAYYRTRMQMMKTGASHSFAPLTEKYRIGFMSINNKTGTSNMGNLFMNISEFTPAHKKEWYDTLFSATPIGDTPLRVALAQAGRLFAGQLKSTYNGHIVKDPVQYSCQQNITILATDGYWTDGLGVQINGTTDIGEQDGFASISRPQFDGGQPSWTQTIRTETKTVTATKRPQIKISETKGEKKILQKNTNDVFQQRESVLQKREWQLTKTAYPLRQNISYLQTQWKKLRQRNYVTTTVATDPNATKAQLQAKTSALVYTRVDKKLQQTITPLIQFTKQVQEQTSTLSAFKYQLKKSEYVLQKTIKQVQRKGPGETEWSPVDVCISGTNYPGVTCYLEAQAIRTDEACKVTTQILNATNPVTEGKGTDVVTNTYKTAVECAYKAPTIDINQDSCTPTANSVPVVSTTGNNTQTTVTLCEYQAGVPTPVSANQGSYPQGSASNGLNTPWSSYTRYDYDAWTQWRDVSSCAPLAQSGSPYTVAVARACQYAGLWVEQESVSSCGESNPDATAQNPYSIATKCAYKNSPNTPIDATACAPQSSMVAQNGTYQPLVTCNYVQTNRTTNQGTCENASSPAGCSESGPTYCQTITTCSDATGLPLQLDVKTCAIGATLTPAMIKTDTSPSSVGRVIASCSSCFPGDAGCSVADEHREISGWLIDQTCTTVNLTNNTPDTDGVITRCKRVANGNICGQNGSNCVVGNGWSEWQYVSSCTPVAGEIVGTSVQCEYDGDFVSGNGGSGTWSNTSSCKIEPTSSGSGTWKEARNCRYSAWSQDPSNLSSCTNNKPPYTAGANLSGTTTFDKAQMVDCTYGNGAVSNVSSCTVKPKSTGSADGIVYSEAMSVACHYASPADFANVSNGGSCTPTTKPSGVTLGSYFANGLSTTQEKVIECKYVDKTSPSWKPVPQGQTCTKVNQCAATNGVLNIDTACSVTTAMDCNQSGWTGYKDATTCTPSTVEQCQYRTDGNRWFVNETCTNMTDAQKANFSVVSGYQNCATTTTGPFDVYSLANPLGVGDRYGTGNPPPALTTAHFAAKGIYGTGSYSLEYLAGTPAASSGAVPVVPGSCVNIPATDTHGNPVPPFHDGTYQQNTVVCTRPLPVTSTVTTCSASAATASNSYTETTCVENPLGAPTPNTLADVAQYYYTTDLRTPELGNCLGAPLEGHTNDTCENIMIPSGRDDAIWQHMQTYTLGLGVSGLMRYQSDYLTAASGDYFSVATGQPVNVTNGTCSWQASGGCNWPVPTRKNQTTIDDLWHAAVNGRGDYYSATDPVSLAGSLNGALEKIDLRDGSLSTAAISSTRLTAADNFLYRASFTTLSWVGQLTAKRLDPDSGAVIECWTIDATGYGTPDYKPAHTPVACAQPLASNTERVLPIWEAQALLDAAVRGSVAKAAARKVYTKAATANTRINFAWDELDATAKEWFTHGTDADQTDMAGTDGLAQLCVTGDSCLTDDQRADFTGENMVNFLRGDSTKEDTSQTKGLYRLREHSLGDIVSAAPVFVGKPSFAYTDKGYPDYKLSQAERRRMVYAAANDGMLHAFYGDTSGDPANNGGKEAWAYVPRLVMPQMYKLSDKMYRNKHRFFVDGSPTVNDICIENCQFSDTQDAVWRTILVGGLNNGGDGYYALDITDPLDPKVLWEFQDNRLGRSYGVPRVTKNKDGQWVVMFGSGYNNADGKGYLFMLDAQTGALATDYPLTTGVGSASDPSGLAQIAVWADFPDYNNKAQRVYAGDLLGNVWRFNMSDNSVQLLTTLKDAASNPQPITVAPELGVTKGNKLVFVGTGKLLSHEDMTTTTTQSIYGILDPLTFVEGVAIYPDIRDPSSLFVKQTMVDDLAGCTTAAQDKGLCKAGEAVKKIDTQQAVTYPPNAGWYLDFIGGTERINTNISLVQGRLLFSTNSPQGSSCVPGGMSNFYYLDYKTGGALASAEGLISAGGSNSFSAGETIFTNQKGDGGTTTGQDDLTNKVPTLPPVVAEPERRVSWRELLIGN